MIEPMPPGVADPQRLAAVRATGLLDTGPEESFDDLATLAARLLGAPFAFVTLVDDERSFWKSRIGIEDGGPTQNTVQQSFCQYVIASGQPLISDDVTLDPVTAGNPSIGSMGVRAWAGFPLMSPDGQALGSFCVVDTVARRWTEQDVETLRVLSAAAAREIALRAGVAALQTASRQLGLLAEAGHVLSGSRTAADAVGLLAELVVPTLGDWSVVALVDEAGTLADVAWWHGREALRPVLDEFAATRLEDLAGTGSTLQDGRDGRPVILESGALERGLATLTSPQARAAYRQLNPEVFGVWPLVFDDTVHGVLVIARDAGRPTFTPEELELAAGIAVRAGTVLDNARLHTRQQQVSDALEAAYAGLREASSHDRGVSRALQDAMLTRLPEPDHLHLSARYLTADHHDQVGGDWYDALLPPGGATTLIIGDVAGHDIAAATVMGQLRNILRALAWEHDDRTPAELIAQLDDAMADLGLRTMTTVLVARIEQTAADAQHGLRRLRWSSAGHPMPVLIDAEGRSRYLAARPDPPVGIGRGFARHDNVTEIGPGQTLLLYTDGLVETRAEGVDSRNAAVLQILDASTGLGLDDTLDTLVTTLVGDHPEDDVALIAVRFHPEDESRPAEAGPSHT